MSLGRIYFDVCMRAACEFDADMARNKNLAKKYIHLVSPLVWGKDEKEETSPDKAWWLGARAFEIEIRDKLIAMQERGELPGIKLPVTG